MNFTIYEILMVLGMHTIFDWIFQTQWQAQNKSKNNEALSRHVLTYTLGLVICASFLIEDSKMWLTWIWINVMLHFITDFITSRLNARFYPNKSFWNCIGIDQFIHYATLFTTLGLTKL